MPDNRRELEFGLSLVPSAADIEEIRTLAARADALGLDLLAVQDHPYQWRFVETWALLADLLARTQRIRVFPDVANLPLRLPAMIAKQAASLDVLSGGRFELGLGAGAFWEGIGAMGGPVRSPGESVDALEEAVRIVRLFWSGERTIGFSGRYYSISGLHPGPAPAHPIGIWIGAYKPRMLELTGRLGDGWVPSLGYAPPPAIPAMRRRVDQAAAEAGRDPRDVRRVYNLTGTISDGPASKLLVGPVSHWVEELSGFALELGFETFIFWPAEDALRQVERFAAEVAPEVRDAVIRQRGQTPAVR
jgi:alkanesulfonate monooxygenase SsuD/methylene tetrahydromethanopterin reductase-like flavin-dependent oxidoreductase (luciferase family)